MATQAQQRHCQSQSTNETLISIVAERPPLFYSFVLTSETGSKIYGASMQVWEDIESKEVLRWVAESDYDGKFPSWYPGADTPPRPPELANRDSGVSSMGSEPSDDYPDILFVPKNLVILSHYPFYNAWRVYLQQLYRISLAGAPLPIERYIANFVCEMPLPPQGQVEVKFGFIDKSCSISRPPKNELPLNDFSYRPLFGCLSVNNILTVFGYLLTEAR